MDEFPHVAIIASAGGRLENKTLIVYDRNCLLAKFSSLGILEGDECLDGHVCGYPIIDMIGPKFEA